MGIGQVGAVSHASAATALAVRLEFHVVPVFEPVGDSCSCSVTDCRSAGKHPRTKDWYTRASCDPEEIARLWSASPRASIGIATGGSSQLLVLDVDDRNGGFESLDQLRDEFKIPPTLESQTGGGGKHIFFDSSNRTLGCSVLAPGIDVRGEGGLVVVPPSHHVTGRKYRWASDPFSSPLAPVPDWLVDELEARLRPGPASGPLRPKQPLSVRIENLLLGGDVDRRYASRSEAEQAVAAGARNAGWTFNDFQDAILDPTNVGGRKAQQLPLRGVRNYLQRTWKTAEKLPQAQRPDSAEIGQAVKTAQQWIEARLSSGLDGQSIWSMAMAILGVVESKGKLRFHLSIRDAAEASGLWPKTAAKALKSLVEMGFISVVAESQEGHATVFELHHSHTRHTGGEL